MCILLCSKPTNCFPSRSRVKAQDRTRPVVLYTSWSAVTTPISSPPPLPHTLHASHKGIFSLQGQVHSHLRTSAFDTATGMLFPQVAISFPHFLGSLLKSASQQGLLWPLLKFHFPVSCCLSLPNHCLTFETYFSSTIYHEKFQTHTKVERITW